MADRPIIFSGPMVRAILDGRKTQTRRLWKPASKTFLWWNVDREMDDDGWPVARCDDGDRHRIRNPYGDSGDTLWVRETHALETNRDASTEDGYNPPFDDGRPVKWVDDPGHGTYWTQPHYRATDNEPALACDSCTDGPACTWAPPIYMPRWACRLFLTRGTDRPPQRLLDITQEDAIAEGASWDPKSCAWAMSDDANGADAREAFLSYWDKLHWKEAPSKRNPWVWVVDWSAMRALTL